MPKQKSNQFSTPCEFVVGKNERLREVTGGDRSHGQAYSSNVGAVKSLQWGASACQILLLRHAADGTFPQTFEPKQVPRCRHERAVKTKFFVNLPDNVEEIGENIEARIS